MRLDNTITLDRMSSALVKDFFYIGLWSNLIFYPNLMEVSNLFLLPYVLCQHYAPGLKAYSGQD